MTLLGICVLCSFVIVLGGNFVYFIILIQRRFKRSTLYMIQEVSRPYISDFQRIIKKVNGWLYLFVFFNCVSYSFGPWSIIFPMLCFLASASGENDLVQFCSVFATISACVILFANPTQKYHAANAAWQKSTKKVELFIIDLQTYDTQETVRSHLIKLSKEICHISEKTRI